MLFGGNLQVNPNDSNELIEGSFIGKDNYPSKKYRGFDKLMRNERVIYCNQ